MNRRQFLMNLAITAGVGFPVGVNAKEAITVVELLNFSCSRCREMESYRAIIEDAAKSQNGRFVFAPVSWEGQGVARDQAYYAARLRGPLVEAAIRKSLFEASQDHNLPLEDLPQVMGWLQQDVSPQLAINWIELGASARSPAILDALFRAARLAKLAAIPSVPTFVILQGESVIHTLNYDLEGGSPPKLVSAVLDKLKGLK